VKIERTVTIKAPPQEVYDVVMDPRRLEDWVTIHHTLDDAPRGEAPVAKQLNDAIARLDARLSQISNPAPTRQREVDERQRQTEMVERAEIIWEKGTNRLQFKRGTVSKYNWVDIGGSYLPGELTAAFLLAQFEKAEEATLARLEGRTLAGRAARFHLKLLNLRHFPDPSGPALPANMRKGEAFSRTRPGKQPALRTALRGKKPC